MPDKHVALPKMDGSEWVRIEPGAGDLCPILKGEAAKATVKGLTPFAYFFADWCGACRKLRASLSDSRMRDAFRGTYIILLDSDGWSARLDGTGFVIRSVPVFFKIDEQGAPTGSRIDGSAWGDDVPENMAPPLSAFFTRVSNNPSGANFESPRAPTRASKEQSAPSGTATCTDCGGALQRVRLRDRDTGEALCLICHPTNGICPFCKQELRTKRARQCFHCSRSWHTTVNSSSAPAQRPSASLGGIPGRSTGRETSGRVVNVGRLKEVVTPEIYRRNAFRVLGLPVEASTRDISRSQRSLSMARKLGIRVAGSVSGFLPLNPPPSGDEVRAALHRLSDPEVRLIDELFWFWPAELDKSEDDEGLNLLRASNAKAALSFWQNAETNGHCRYVAVHNLAVLYHVAALDLETKAIRGSVSEPEVRASASYWLLSYRRWRALQEDENFWQRVLARAEILDDPRLTPETIQHIRGALPWALLGINSQLAVRWVQTEDRKAALRQAQIMRKSGFSGEVAAEILKDGLSPTRERIRSLCKRAETTAESNPETAHEVAAGLMQEARPLRKAIDGLLGEGHPTRDAALDEIANTVFRCVVLYGNKTEDWHTCAGLLQKAFDKSAGEATRAKLRESLETVKKNQKLSMCFFCEKSRPDDSAAIEVPMYGNVRRIPTFSGVRVTWSSIKVKVPRCRLCKGHHDRISATVGGGGGIAALIALVVWGIAASTLKPIIGWGEVIWGGVAALFIGGVIGSGISSALPKARLPDGVKPESSKDRFEAIKKLKSEGFCLGEEPSTA